MSAKIIKQWRYSIKENIKVCGLAALFHDLIC